MAAIRAYEHFPTCLGVIPDGPSHRFADSGRHRPTMTIAMPTIGSLGGRPRCYLRVIYGLGDLEAVLSTISSKLGTMGDFEAVLSTGTSIFGKSSNRTHFASRGLGWTPTDI